METTEEEHEQAVVTSTSSPHSIVDALDSRWTIDKSAPARQSVCSVEYNEKPESERVLTPELEQILLNIAKTGYSR